MFKLVCIAMLGAAAAFSPQPVALRRSVRTANVMSATPPQVEAAAMPAFAVPASVASAVALMPQAALAATDTEVSQAIGLGIGLVAVVVGFAVGFSVGYGAQEKL